VGCKNINTEPTVPMLLYKGIASPHCQKEVLIERPAFKSLSTIFIYLILSYVITAQLILILTNISSLSIV